MAFISFFHDSGELLRFKYQKVYIHSWRGMYYLRYDKNIADIHKHPVHTLTAAQAHYLVKPKTALG